MPYNVAVIGYGLSAKIFHIPFITALPQRYTLYGIVQRNPTDSNNCQNDHKGVKLFRSVDEMLADKDVDVVVDSTLPEVHFEHAKKAMEAGKHVVVEKPFVPTHKDAEELVAIMKKTGKKMTVYQNRRFDSDFLTLRSLLDTNTLGRIVEFETHFDRHRPQGASWEAGAAHNWKAQDRPGVGQIYDLGTHLIDQVYHLYGPPKKVTAFLANQREKAPKEGPKDSFSAYLHYDNGLLATVKAGVVSPEREQLRYWIRGEKGSFKKFHLDVQEDQLKQGLRPGASNYGVDPEDHWGILTTAQQDGSMMEERFKTVDPATYVKYYEIFADALDGKGEVPVSPQDASQVIRIIELCKESSETGRSVDV